MQVVNGNPAPASQQLSPEMLEELMRLRQENAALKAKKPTGGIKVSSKGGISVYGLGRFPITLYASQWESLLGKSEEIKQFILDNAASLARKEA